MLRTLPLLLAALMVSSAALADEARDPTEVHVSIQGVDFANRADVAKLYDRLQRAANAACDSDIDTLRAKAEDRACAAKALDGVVQSINQPLLAELHGGDSNVKVASIHP
jgi:UrcA family protein